MERTYDMPLSTTSSSFKPALKGGQGINRLPSQEERLLKAAGAQGGGSPGLRSLSESAESTGHPSASTLSPLGVASVPTMETGGWCIWGRGDAESLLHAARWAWRHPDPKTSSSVLPSQVLSSACLPPLFTPLPHLRAGGSHSTAHLLGCLE